MSLLKSPSINHNMAMLFEAVLLQNTDLLQTTGSLQNTGLLTFEHSPLSTDNNLTIPHAINLNNIFTSPHTTNLNDNFNSQLTTNLINNFTSSVATNLNSIFTSSDISSPGNKMFTPGTNVSALTPNTEDTEIDTYLNQYNVNMRPSLLVSPDSVIAIQTPLHEARITAAIFLQSPNIFDIMENQVTPPIMENQVTPPIMEDQVTPPIMEDQVTPPIMEDQVTPPIMEDQVIPPIMEDQVFPIEEGQRSILEDIMSEPIRKKPRF